MAFLFALTSAFAQSNTEEIDFMQSIFGMEKKAMAEEFITVSEEQSEDFWALYDEYEKVRKEMGKKRIELLNRYAEEYSTMTNETVDAWMKDVLALTKKNDAHLITYYHKINKACSPVVATQFYQLELYIKAEITEEILEVLPFAAENGIEEE